MAGKLLVEILFYIQCNRVTMVTVATVQRETTYSKQNLNLATCQSETSSDASQNSKGCTVPPPSLFLLLWKAVLCLQCLFYLWTFCWCSSPVLFYSQFLLRWNAWRSCQSVLSVAVVPVLHFSFTACYTKLLPWLELEKLLQEGWDVAVLCWE